MMQNASPGLVAAIFVVSALGCLLGAAVVLMIPDAESWVKLAFGLLFATLAIPNLFAAAFILMKRK